MTRVLNTCPECGENAKARYCSRRCANIASNRNRQVRAADDVRVRRRARVADAPGLTEYGIRKLTLKWRSQRRRCTYCAALATTADHVLPLVRGGTNYEGNLAPCCKACNSRKAGFTVIEWRTGLRLAPMTESLDAMGRRRPPRAPRLPKSRPSCTECGADCTEGRRRYCSERCAAEAKRTYMRDYMFKRYRTDTGIPLDRPRRKYERA